MDLDKHFNFQPNLQSQRIIIRPLQKDDFGALFNVASDQEMWKQHPNSNRYQPEIFRDFFDEAIKSEGAFLVSDALSGNVIGSSRFYDYNPSDNSIFIGYTFLGRKYWGGIYNGALKKLMIDHAFNYVSKVKFHIGETNFRSQKAVSKIGAIKVDEQEMSFPGEEKSLNFIYQIKKEDWTKELQ